MPTTTVYPNGVGFYTQWPTVHPAGSTHWTVVDEEPPDEFSSYIVTSTGEPNIEKRDSYAHQALGLPVGATITNVRILNQDYSTPTPIGAEGEGRTLLRNDAGTDAFGAWTYPDPDVWTDIVTDYANSPFTGLAWTEAEVDAMEIGCCGITRRDAKLTTSIIYCTQVKLIVSYTVPVVAAPAITSEGLTWITQTPKNKSLQPPHLFRGSFMRHSSRAIITLLVFTSLFYSLFPVVTNYAIESTIHFSEIQEAINRASPGDVLSIPGGEYCGVVNVNKSLTLIGKNTMIDGGGSQVGVIITAPNVTLQGFTIRNIIRFGNGNGSIPLELPELCHYLELDGSAIYVYKSNYVTISNVTIARSYAGIGIARSNFTNIVNATIGNTTWGIMLYRALGIKVFNSTIANCFDLADNNGGAVWIWDESTVNMEYNTFLNNLWGVIVSPTIMNYQVNYNNFKNNTHQGYIHPDATTCGNWNYNYWSDYNGSDINADGIGDTPYTVTTLRGKEVRDSFPLMKETSVDTTSTPKESAEDTGGGGGSRTPLLC